MYLFVHVELIGWLAAEHPELPSSTPVLPIQTVHHLKTIVPTQESHSATKRVFSPKHAYFSAMSKSSSLLSHPRQSPLLLPNPPSSSGTSFTQRETSLSCSYPKDWLDASTSTPRT